MVNTLTAGSTATSRASESAAAGRKRLTAAERRAQLIEVAISVFGQRGFRGATTKAIADAAGISEATIFRHFPSKDDLYVAALPAAHRRRYRGNSSPCWRVSPTGTRTKSCCAPWAGRCCRDTSGTAICIAC